MAVFSSFRHHSSLNLSNETEAYVYKARLCYFMLLLCAIMPELVVDAITIIFNVLAADARSFGDIANLSLASWPFRLEILAVYFKYHPPLHRPYPPLGLSVSFNRIRSIILAFGACSRRLTPFVARLTLARRSCLRRDTATRFLVSRA